jgi:hypothetical protein
VASFVALIFTFGMEAPVGSVTDPEMPPRSTWPKHKAPVIAITAATASTRF